MKRLSTILMALAMLLGAVTAGLILVLQPQPATSGVCQQGTRTCVWKDVQVPKGQFLIAEGDKVTIMASDQPSESGENVKIVKQGGVTYSISIVVGDWKIASHSEVLKLQCNEWLLTHSGKTCPLSLDQSSSGGTGVGLTKIVPITVPQGQVILVEGYEIGQFNSLLDAILETHSTSTLSGGVISPLPGGKTYYLRINDGSWHMLPNDKSAQDIACKDYKQYVSIGVEISHISIACS
jgi:hypothetical protein